MDYHFSRIILICILLSFNYLTIKKRMRTSFILITFMYVYSMIKNVYINPLFLHETLNILFYITHCYTYEA